jgi:peroxiredoxin Q/BCP
MHPSRTTQEDPLADLSPGDTAPDFTLPQNGGDSVSLAGLRGREVVLFFYPKDDTSGCTMEACGFRDRYGDLVASGATILGVSPDSVSSHDRFASKFSLPFPLLADTDHRVAEAYGVWKERSMYGKKFMGIERSTFLIDKDGQIAKAWKKVKPEGHAEEVLETLQQGA